MYLYGICTISLSYRMLFFARFCPFPLHWELWGNLWHLQRQQLQQILGDGLGVFLWVLRPTAASAGQLDWSRDSGRLGQATEQLHLRRSHSLNHTIRSGGNLGRETKQKKKKKGWRRGRWRWWRRKSSGRNRHDAAAAWKQEETGSSLWQE